MSWVWVVVHFTHRITAAFNRLRSFLGALSLSPTSADPGCLSLCPQLRKEVVAFLTHLKKVESEGL